VNNSRRRELPRTRLVVRDACRSLLTHRSLVVACDPLVGGNRSGGGLTGQCPLA
jgi:hypothetical protein